MGFSARIESAGREGSWHSYASTVVCSRPGTIGDAIVFAAPLDAPPGLLGAASRAMPAIILLDLMEEASALWGGKPPLTLEFAFLGEEYPAAEAFPGVTAPCGSDALAEALPQNRLNEVGYVDVRDASGRLRVVNHSARVVSPYRIFQVLSSSLAAEGLGFSHGGAFNQFYRAGLVVDENGPRPRGAYGRSGGAAPFLDRDVPAIELVSEPGAEPGPRAGLVRALARFVEGHAEGVSYAWDRHYLVVDLPSGAFAVREKDFVVLVLAFIALVILIFFMTSLVERSQLSRMLRGFRRDSWALILSAAFCLGAVWASSLALRAILALKGSPLAWRVDQTAFLAMRHALLAALMVAAFGAALSLRIIPSTIALYSAGSVILFFLDVFIASLIDVSLSLYFAWAALCCIASIMLRSRPATLVLAFAGILPLAGLHVLAAWVQGDRMRAILISPSLGESVVLVFLYLPVVLYIVRAILIIRSSHESPRFSRTLPVLVLASATFLGVTAFTALRPAYSRSRPQPLAVTEEAAPDGSGTVTVSGPGRFSGLSIEVSGVQRALSGARREVLPRPAERRPPRAAVDTSFFLSRKRIRTTIDAPEGTYRALVRVKSKSRIELYGSSFPYALSDDGLSAELSVGILPPSPLVLELTVPASFEGDLEATLVSLGSGASVSGNAVIASHVVKREVRARLR